MIVSLDFHDLSVENTNMFYLNKLREQYPGIRVSAFFIPADAQYFHRLVQFQKEESKQEIKKAVEDGWLELIPHGLTHTFGEFKNATYADMELAIKAYEEFFSKWGVPYVKGFCAPNWLISSSAVNALNDNGWWLAIDRNQPDCLKAKRNYVYNWDIAEPFPKGERVVMGHGHISGPSINNLPDCIANLSKIPQCEWKFVSELVK